MATVVIELEGMLEFGEQEGGYACPIISVGGPSLCCVIEEALRLPEEFSEGKLGPCKLRLEIEQEK